MTMHEMYTFLATLIVIGVDKKPRVRNYWSSKSYHKNLWCQQMFKQERFEALFQSMLLCRGENGVDKIKMFVDQLIKKYQTVFYPFQNVSLDEMVIGRKGRWKHKQYNASKPHIKTFVLCGSASGYCFNILIYFSKDTSYHPEMDPEGL